jgi:hypothetical protein
MMETYFIQVLPTSSVLNTYAYYALLFVTVQFSKGIFDLDEMFIVFYRNRRAI